MSPPRLIISRYRPDSQIRSVLEKLEDNYLLFPEERFLLHQWLGEHIGPADRDRWSGFLKSVDPFA